MESTAPFDAPLNVLVTGTSLLLRRHKHIFEALARYFAHVDYLPERRVSPLRRAAYALGSTIHRRAPRTVTALVERFGAIHPWDARIFVARSLRLESQIAKLADTPNFILHLFGMFCPFWSRPRIPYAMILDYTEALAYRNWRDWAPFPTEASFRARLLCEKRAYQNAAHLFPFGNGTRRSLIEDYGIDPAKITVIGSSGHFGDPALSHRTFGSKRILCYCGGGREFYRKGGDRVLGAFQMVRRQIPDAKLAIVGLSSKIAEPGVENHGYVASPEKMRELFSSSDLVLAPARCDPFPTFLIEAMNFGVPSVTSNADGMPEIVAHGITGVVISEPSAPQLAAEVICLLNDPQRLMAMSRSAQERASSKFSSAHVATLVAEAIQKLPIHPTVDREQRINPAPLLETPGYGAG